MAKVRLFISYDYDHDKFLKEALVEQARNDDSPFEISDWSVKVEDDGWKEDAKKRIKAASQVAVICGEHTSSATGVAFEVTTAQGEAKPYFLLNGYSDKTGQKPKSASPDDKLYKWTWDNLKTLIGGGR